MSSAKITELAEVTIVDALNDYLVIVDVSDTSMAISGTTKKLLPSNLPISSGVQEVLDNKIGGISSSISGRLPLFDGSGGNLLKEYTGTGIVKVASGIPTTLTAPNGSIVGTSDTQIMTNKTISGANNTLLIRLANDVSGILPVSNGGTGYSGYTNGQLLIGDTSTGNLIKNTLTAGSGITIVNGSGSITIHSIASSGGGGGSGDVVGPGSSVDSEVVLFNSTTGKLIKSASTTGIAKLTSGVLSTVTAPTGLILGDSDSQVISNKRINSRVFTVTSTGTAVPDVSTTDHYIITAQSSSLTISIPTGTPINGQKLLYTFSDNGTQRSITWNAIHKAIGVILPTGTIPSGIIYAGEIYNGNANRWDVLAVGSGI